MASEATNYREDVEQARRRFSEFRQTHAARSRLPKELWATATKLARRDGVTATARALGVDYPSLYKWTNRLEPSTPGRARKSARGQQSKSNGASAFVELLASSTGTTTSCVVEVGSASGGKLRLDLKAIVTSQLAELIRAFAASQLMLAITPQMRILVAVEAVDFRKGIDSLAELCRAKLNADPFSGCVFVFRSRRATSINLLVYDGQGFWLATKRLSKGRFRWWPQSNDASKLLRVHQAQVLLSAGNPEVDAAPVWRSI